MINESYYSNKKVKPKYSKSPETNKSPKKKSIL